MGYQAAGFDVLAVSYLVAVYGAVRAGHRSATLGVTVGLLAVLQLSALVSHDGSAREAVTQARSTLKIAWLIAAFSAGEAVRQAERRADEAEHTREEIARRRADEERLRIARQLHDSLTHQISVIKVQSEVAVHVARRRGEVSQALLAIQEAGREASRELRATLEALRDDDTTPPPGLDHIPQLVKQFQMTGLETTLTIGGHPHDLPAAVGRTAYALGLSTEAPVGLLFADVDAAEGHAGDRAGILWAVEGLFEAVVDDADGAVQIEQPHEHRMVLPRHLRCADGLELVGRLAVLTLLLLLVAALDTDEVLRG